MTANSEQMLEVVSRLDEIIDDRIKEAVPTNIIAGFALAVLQGKLLVINITNNNMQVEVSDREFFS